MMCVLTTKKIRIWVYDIITRNTTPLPQYSQPSTGGKGQLQPRTHLSGRRIVRTGPTHTEGTDHIQKHLQCVHISVELYTKKFTTTITHIDTYLNNA